jgi:hypothetical protein
LILREYDPKSKEYTGRKLEKEVRGYVGKWKIDDLAVFWSRKDIDSKGI